MWQQPPDLERALSSLLGGQQRIARIERRPHAYRSTFPVQQFRIALEDGTVVEIIAKDVSARALRDSGRAAKPVFLHDPMREIEAYRRIVGPCHLGANFYGAYIDRREDQYWLYIEKVDGEPLWQIGDFAIWEEAARWLAAFHSGSTAWQRHPPGLESTHFLRFDRPYYERWLRRAAAFAGAPSATPHALEAVLRVYARGIDHLLQMPTAIIHGDFYASNILVEQANGVRICPVDWELTAMAPPLTDLAALVAGRWSDGYKERLARAYYALLARTECKVPGYEHFARDLDWCRLHVAVQWLGWAPDWTPPAEHVQDWLAEATRIAQRLDG